MADDELEAPEEQESDEEKFERLTEKPFVTLEPKGPPLRSRATKNPDGSSLTFTETSDRSGFDVVAVGADGTTVNMTISKGEARTHGRFLRIGIRPNVRR